ncbi:2-amino-4-hydroxy-6-hydroxymethyldihydropteridine diphosphokinase [Phaeodactylibacter xiamenensis]|uniref:2-amino-4-hydroxy-6- hydroxymethyldihydropteridine diphosphokinase n=1 Tax=Phaeodactylibacter xiamenensis TaxID=1524460 RepID=UPI0024A7C527|nr:2-amino-4-hydroxy-6-hydroxymethyldihydropteridine diphosphokinase [Phaeodactylibacter xiamenensis]
MQLARDVIPDIRIKLYLHTNMKRVFLHTGSNQGDRLRNLKLAASALKETVGPILHFSRIFETAAWGVRDQPDFLNQALELETALDPIGLLNTVLEIELDMGRVRIQKWGQRLIDIDILYYGDIIWESDQLTLPHPHLHERNFVLAPLLDIAPDFVHPRLKKTTRELRSLCNDALPALPFQSE